MNQVAREAVTLGLMMFDLERAPQLNRQTAHAKFKELREQLLTGTKPSALSLSEGEPMPNDKREVPDEELEEAEDVTIEEGDEEAAEEAAESSSEDGGPMPHTKQSFLSESEVTSQLNSTNLPDAAKEHLTAAQYADEDALKAAITAEVAYVKKLTGSGKPFAQGGFGAAPTKITERDRIVRFNEIAARHGVGSVPVPEEVK